MIHRMKMIADLAVFRQSFQIIRYFGVGVSVSLGYTVTAVFLIEKLGLSSPTLANSISFILWTPISYIIHKKFTFRNNQPPSESAVKFFIIFVSKLAASILVIEATMRFLDYNYLVGLLLNWVVLPLVTFVLLKVWVFNGKSKVDHITAGN